MSAREQLPLHGPLSLVGVAAGLVVAATPYAVGVPGLPWWPILVFGPAVLGLLLLLLARDGARQLGTGLLASGLALPVGLAAVVAAGLLAG